MEVILVPGDRDRAGWEIDRKTGRSLGDLPSDQVVSIVIQVG